MNDKKDTIQTGSEEVGLFKVAQGNNQNGHTFSYLYKKTTKLLAAIYILTDSYTDLEEVQELRGAGRVLIKDISFCLTSAHVEGKERIEGDIFYMCSLVEVVVVMGIISKMNGMILIEELKNNISSLKVLDRSSAQSVRHSPEINPEYFAASAAPEEGLFGQDQRTAKINELVQLEKKRDTLRIAESYRTVTKGPIAAMNDARRTERSIKDRILPQKGQVALKDISSKVSIAERQNSRDQIILDEIRRKGQVSIRDIAALMTGVSEKTVQRELLALVARGVLEKRGERRWSTYVLRG